MEDSIRLFVAASLPPALKQQLQQALLPFQHPAIRFMPEQNLHLTLFFIGQVPRTQLAAISQTVQQTARQHPPFSLDFAGVEPGPNPKHPRLVWARFATHPAFAALSQALTEALATVPPKHLKAIPHVTLARFRKDQPTTALPAAVTAETTSPLQLPVLEIGLWQSELASPHPRYSVLQTFALGQNPLPPNAV
ncbi:RNA 2',3'-cyclic phosphodiesterase [Pontibacter sp. CAU 1760]